MRNTSHNTPKLIKSHDIIEQIGIDNAEAAYRKIVELALAGDLNACKYIVDKVAPNRKGAKIKIDLPKSINTAEQLDAATNKIVRMMADGIISIEEAQMICNTLEFRYKTIELRDMVRQVEDLRKEMDMLKQSTP